MNDKALEAATDALIAVVKDGEVQQRATWERAAKAAIDAYRAALRKNAPGLVGRLRDQEGRLHVHKDHTTFDRMYLVDGTWMLDFINAASDAADALEALAPQEGTDETQ